MLIASCGGELLRSEASPLGVYSPDNMLSSFDNMLP